jgi:hypothetical protein
MLTTLTSEQKKDLKNKFMEISNSMTRIEAERDHMKTIYQDLKEEFEMHPKIARRLAKAYHKQAYQQMVAEEEEFQETYSEVFPSM